MSIKNKNEKWKTSLHDFKVYLLTHQCVSSSDTYRHWCLIYRQRCLVFLGDSGVEDRRNLWWRLSTSAFGEDGVTGPNLSSYLNQ